MAPGANGNGALAARDLAWGDGLSPAMGAGRVDLAAAERAATNLLAALGADVDSEHLHETPRRVAAAFAELLSPVPFTATTFPNDGDYDELVMVRDIPFQSLCAHHLLPFYGAAHLAYLPGERIIGSPNSAASSTCLLVTSRCRSG
jgi:GTP cyclohydrolase IA